MEAIEKKLVVLDELSQKNQIKTVKPHPQEHHSSACGHCSVVHHVDLTVTVDTVSTCAII